MKDDIDRYGHRIGRKAGTTTTLIMDTFMSLMETSPWHLLRISDVARRAQVSVATVYTYYADIEALARACAQRESERGLPLHLAKVMDLLEFEDGMGVGRP